MNILLFLVLVSGGMAMVVYSYQLTKTFGYMEWAEKYLGSGGTYLGWKLIGVGCVIAGFYLLVNY